MPTANSRSVGGDPAKAVRRAALRLVNGAEVYDEIILGELPRARVSVWIATANLKELRIPAPVGTRARAAGRFVSVLDTLADLTDRGVDVRILHARAPSGPFATALRRRTRLAGALTLRECPRVHLKTFTIDGRLLYMGSANFTGAGLGARSDQKRNFELGIITEDEHLLDETQAHFDDIWSGRYCGTCKLRSVCPSPIDQLQKRRSAPASLDGTASRARRKR